MICHLYFISTYWCQSQNQMTILNTDTLRLYTHYSIKIKKKDGFDGERFIDKCIMQQIQILSEL